MPHEFHHDGYLISDDPALLDTGAIHAYLTRSYWAEGIPRDVVVRSLAHSLCLGIYTANREQAGLARMISDYTTFAYLCDVYVLEPHRGRGLSKALMRALATHPRLQNLRRQHLLTQDARPLRAIRFLRRRAARTPHGKTRSRRLPAAREKTVALTPGPG